MLITGLKKRSNFVSILLALQIKIVFNTFIKRVSLVFAFPGIKIYLFRDIVESLCLFIKISFGFQKDRFCRQYYCF